MVEYLEHPEILLDGLLDVLDVHIVLDESLGLKVVAIHFAVFLERRCVYVVGPVLSFDVISNPFIENRR